MPLKKRERVKALEWGESRLQRVLKLTPAHLARLHAMRDRAYLEQKQRLVAYRGEMHNYVCGVNGRDRVPLDCWPGLF